MTKAIRTLERRALDAPRAGLGWAQFWASNGHAIRDVEPYHRGRYRRLVNRLLALVVSGDCDGMEPAGDTLEPWEADDQPEALAPNDTITAARIDWSAGGIIPMEIKQ